MGCLKSKLGKKKDDKRPSGVFYIRQCDADPSSRLSGEEVLQQLREEGIVRTCQAAGGVAFTVTVTVDGTPRRNPQRRLERLSVKAKPHYTRDERHIIAEITRFDRMVEQVQQKALDRACQRRLVSQEKERRNTLKKLQARNTVALKEKKLKEFEEARDAARKMAAEKKAAKKKAIYETKKVQAKP